MKIQLGDNIFKTISLAASQLNIKAYVVGGFIRDAIIGRNSKDIDIVAVGSGIELAREVANMLNIKKVAVYKNFGTAQIKVHDIDIEFVGARKESYQRNSRKPIVENGSLADDQLRRDFTINALAASLSKKDFGTVLAPFNGLDDLQNRIIRTQLEPIITFNDDPLRMIRAIRFASQLGFDIESETYKAISVNAERLKIVSIERIIDEFNKIIFSPKPSVGIEMLEETGLLAIFFPQLVQLKGVENIEGKMHKDNFAHTLQVVDQISLQSNDLWLRWSALLHDIGKPTSKHYNKETGWTFHGHEVTGAKMVEEIFRNLRLPLNEKLKYVQNLVGLHLRPIALVHEVVTDSAVRRLLFEAGENIEDLMQLAEADITSKNEKKVQLYLKNFKTVRQKLKEVEAKDKIRNMHPPVSGKEIMKIFNLTPCKIVGDLKNEIKDAILDGLVANEREAVLIYLFKIAKDKGIEPITF
jgi:poly(A) polymerase